MPNNPLGANPQWVVYDDIGPIPAPPPMQAEPGRIFLNLGKKKKPIEPARDMWDDDYLKLLLSGLKEIFEAPCEISGSALVERQLGAKNQRDPLYVTMIHRDLRNNYDEYLAFMGKFEELGWGQGQEQPRSKEYWLKFKFIVRGRPVILVITDKDHPFDEYKLNVNMIRFTLENGWEQDDRSKKDFDKRTITCNTKPPAGMYDSLRAQAAYYEELTGKKWTVKGIKA